MKNPLAAGLLFPGRPGFWMPWRQKAVPFMKKYQQLRVSMRPDVWRALHIQG